MKDYISFGFTKLEKSKFVKPQNTINTKPIGGLWACRNTPFTNSKGDMFQSDWEHWCRFQQYNLDKLNFATRFNISENARICTINTKEDYESLPSFVISGLYKLVLDYEELAKDYDVLEITSEGLSNNYDNLYNWDIPSVLILNFDVISEQERVVIKKPFIITRLISSIMKYGKRLAHGF